MVTCPSCGAQNETRAAFCDSCGTPLAGGVVAGGPPPAVGGDVRCPACGYPNTPGEAFCVDCGASLANVAPAPVVQPAPVYAPPPVAPQAPYAPPPPVAPQAPYAPPPSIAAATLTPQLTVLGDGYQVTLSGKSSYLIGREDPASNVFPDVDLSPHGGIEGGVGRRHANLHVQGGQAFIEDLDSVNHTYVNRQRLQPNVPQPLNPGDEIRLGKVVLRYQ